MHNPSKRKRKPLSDITNTSEIPNKQVKSTLPKPLTTTKSKPTTRASSSHFIKPSQFLNLETTVAEKTASTSKPTDVSISAGSEQQPIESTPPRTPIPSFSSSSSCAADTSNVVGSVYTRRQSTKRRERRTKEKAIMEPNSCFPALMRASTGCEVNEVEGTSQPKVCSAPQTKKRQWSPADLDVIKKQKEYFAELDAFQLSEEEVDSVDDSD